MPAGAEEVYLFKITAAYITRWDRLKPILGEKLFMTSGNFIGFTYAAKIGYFDYRRNGLTSEEALGYFKNLALIARGIWHNA